ncbi:MAG: NAD-dependent protein deacylase [Dehalococcoidia bacterium]|nr:NAD-dependent protein deacylase [Dehalococcoidia bacterium]
MARSEKIVVFTGAGVSTESGIPDFRSPGGIWDRFDPDDFTYQKFIRDASARRKQWQLLWKERLTETVKPNPAHYAIADLDKIGKLDCVITQNVDSLHQAAGVPDDKVFELHGSMRRVVCLQCSQRYPMAEIKQRLDAGEEVPDCAACHGILKPDIVLFGEALPDKVFSEATFHAEKCDLFIVVGSSLVVYPAALIPGYAVDAGARLVIINLSETPMDERADILIRARAGEAMSRIIRKLTEKRSG